MELVARALAQGGPRRAGVGVALLERDDGLARAVGEGGVVVEAVLGLAVEGVEVLDVRAVLARVAKVGDEHAELGAPVADMADAVDLVVVGLEEAREGVADDRRAEVADVHLLGHVGRGVVDDHVLALRSGAQLIPPALARSPSAPASQASLRRKLTKPGGATCGGSNAGDGSIFAASSCAISSGLRLSGFASRSAALHW